jgi:hypothetical protein
MHQMTTSRQRERGEGKLGAIVGWLFFLAICYAGWQVLPAYIANYAWKDKMNEVARRQRYTPQGTDEAITEVIMKDARERGLDRYVQKADIRIQTTDSSRRIYAAYTREIEVLPGWKKIFKFENDVEQPLL